MKFYYSNDPNTPAEPIYPECLFPGATVMMNFGTHVFGRRCIHARLERLMSHRERQKQMIVYFSSAAYEYPADPEVVVPDAAVMISYINNQQKIHERAEQLMRHREWKKNPKRSRPSLGKTKTKEGRELPADKEIDCSSLFLDSGAFTMRQQSWKFEKETGKSWRDFYDTPEFWNYADAYAAFVKQNEKRLDLYANLDVIPDPELSWRNQQYLESKGIKPVPVVHLKTPMKWVKHYMSRGYDLLGLGGLVASGGFGSQRGIYQWLDEVFNLICHTSKGTPCIKTHGFGLMGPVTYRYPFYSVDSTAWVMKGSFGWVLIPKKRKGRFVFGEDPPHRRSDMPYSVAVTDPSLMPEGTVPGRMDDHFLSLGKNERKLVMEWLDLIQIPYGKVNVKGEIVEEGVSTNRRLRILAGLRFYEEMLKRYKDYPWPFSTTTRQSFGLLG